MKKKLLALRKDTEKHFSYNTKGSPLDHEEAKWLSHREAFPMFDPRSVSLHAEYKKLSKAKNRMCTLMFLDLLIISQP